MTDIPEEIRAEARKAIYDDGRGMIGRNRSHLEDRVARALLSERRKQIERDAKVVEGFSIFPGREAIAAAIRAQQEPK